MNLQRGGHRTRSMADHAFTLIEALVALGAVGVVVLAMYAGLSSVFKLVRMSRENQRATQIMVEKLETVRLNNWAQINSNGFIPRAFQAYYHTANGTNHRTVYDGAITITSAPLDTTYSNFLRHYDEQLEKSGPMRVLVVTSWNEI
jgi:type II secretory pathway pseudopilin PulG